MIKPEEDKPKTTIMIVEDDPMQQLLLSEALSEDDYHLIIASNGQEAVDSFKKHLPELVILDVYMPIMNGFDVCKTIRSLDEGKYTSILIATSAEDDSSINKAFEVGATDFIIKPINWTILRHRIVYSLRAKNNLCDLDDSRHKNEALLNALPDNMYCFDKNGICTDFKDYSQKSKCFLGKHITNIFPSKISKLFLDKMAELYENSDNISFEYSISEVESVKYFEARLVLNDTQILAIIRDISEKKRTDEKITKMAYYDKLTGLPNSLYFKNELEQKLSVATSTKSQYSIVFIDLDRFKHINDSFGHTVGDQLLKLAVSRLQNCFNQCLFLRDEGKSKLELFARFGGDEFILLLKDNNQTNVTSRLAQYILDNFTRPFQLEKTEIYVTPSIGISVSPKDGKDVDTLVKNADAAMYHSKKMGRNTFNFYDSIMNKNSHELIELESKMRKAFEQRHFVIYYQPQVSVQSGKVVGAEALIRWIDPEIGLIPPSQFIPIAEEIGLIEDLGNWILENACCQMKTWLMNTIDLNSVSINLSAKQFRDASLIRSIEGILRKTELPPHYLDIELTESMIMFDEPNPIETLNALHDLGLKLALDDFGTGYSSLSYLKDFPMDYLKIDRSFITHLEVNSVDRNIVKGIISMAKALQLTIIAEGVETKEQFEFLQNIDCDIIQGFYFAKPMPADEFEIFYKEFNSKNRLITGNGKG